MEGRGLLRGLVYGQQYCNAAVIEEVTNVSNVPVNPGKVVVQACVLVDA